MRKTLLPFLAFCLFIQGCAWGVIQDQRLMDTMASDKAMAASIKTDLLKDRFTDAFSISVYCFYDHVFLVGEVPPDARAKAIEIAKSYKPLSVTPHWFNKTTNERGDFMLATDLRAALIGAKGLSSTRIDTEVNSGRVVLLGVVKDEQEKRIAIDVARKVKGVVSVTSYLMLPQRPGAPISRI
ncbi:MAG: BON domain-containing protein [Desulfovibrio sp.]|nr:BON domain-containing protein [Desulfovibrio sp.]